MSSATETRPVRVANCSGYHGDPAYEMYRQATLGDVDFITGDYLAEVNLANNAQAWREGKHPGYEATAWEGLQQTIEVIAQKRIRVVINGGALDPKALALKTQALVSEKKLDLRVAYLSGDDLYDRVGPNMPATKEELTHLDAGNSDVVPSDLTYAFLNTSDGTAVPMVSAHAYLGARGIVDGLRRGADIIICGRVADASPVIAAAWYWHNWSETDYDELAGSLIAGHLIECSAYVTGANFAGFDKYPLDDLVAPGFPIAEIAADGTCVITKHPNTQGIVNSETVSSQFLYELQGSTYLNSDVSAYIGDVAVKDVGKDRVHVSGIRGSPPPPTTKLAVFYRGGYEAQLLLNATGYATDKKWDLFERQMRHFLPEEVKKGLETLEFQRIGTPAANPAFQAESTTYLRVFVASQSESAVLAVAKAMKDISLKHFSGFHTSLDTRTAIPLPFLAYYPALIKQSEIHEKINMINASNNISSYDTGHPSQYQDLTPRENYDSAEPQVFRSPTKELRLGDIALGRSGDKGGNLNCGIFVTNPKHWAWLRSYLTRDQIRELIGKDWNDSFFIERVEFPNIMAVHFVIYGILGRGVSSSSRLDGFGKGFVDYIRDKVVDVPVEILG
ncbi:acyclic terpene utilization AtuA family protein [Aspergillus tubingensis]|uniref:acyclic terpene utilization AtuA family protein n=1 Tax=Aspergillus tubingensis TaxID=5068 RepID=UPI001577C29F|nr:DUF1446 domain-containing protein [Aspergillus tubingensis]GFN15020.1 DUF1446 domain-containing protein [Aspergillus tubingensis]GLB00481.1 hypothetical protein AtubIFM57143_009533 [Aspergillus tubingensis]GLB13661.1 hypothetical protein AtubIFM61612_001073 [Aspergillus tubingensis]